MPTSAGRLFDEAAAELETLRLVLADGLEASDLAHEQRFRQALQRVAQCCEHHESVIVASRALRMAAVRAFALPHDPARLEAMHAALGVLTKEVERVRALLIKQRIVARTMAERRARPRDQD